MPTIKDDTLEKLCHEAVTSTIEMEFHLGFDDDGLCYLCRHSRWAPLTRVNASDLGASPGSTSVDFFLRSVPDLGCVLEAKFVLAFPASESSTSILLSVFEAASVIAFYLGADPPLVARKDVMPWP